MRNKTGRRVAKKPASERRIRTRGARLPYAVCPVAERVTSSYPEFLGVISVLHVLIHSKQHLTRRRLIYRPGTARLRSTIRTLCPDICPDVRWRKVKAYESTPFEAVFGVRGLGINATGRSWQRNPSTCSGQAIVRERFTRRIAITLSH